MSTTESTTTFLTPVDEEARRLLFTQARSANTFTDEPVSDEQLREIYELAKFGPTSANINPLRILFLRPGPGRERLLPLMNEGNRAKTATAPRRRGPGQRPRVPRTDPGTAALQAGAAGGVRRERGDAPRRSPL